MNITEAWAKEAKEIEVVRGTRGSTFQHHLPDSILMGVPSLSLKMGGGHGCGGVCVACGVLGAEIDACRVFSRTHLGADTYSDRELIENRVPWVDEGSVTGSTRFVVVRLSWV